MPTKPKKENKEIKEILEEIDEWQFAECPTEEKEPFFWRWTKYGKEQLACCISDLLKAQNSQTLKTLKQEIEEIAKQGHGGGNWQRLFNQVISLINKRLKK